MGVSGFQFDPATHLPFLAAGLLIGLASFGVLMLALVPVLAHRRVASVGRGLLSVAVSFALLLAGAVGVYQVAEGALLAYLIGALAALIGGWTALAFGTVSRR